MTLTLLVEERTLRTLRTLHSEGLSMGRVCCCGYWRFDFVGIGATIRTCMHLYAVNLQNKTSGLRFSINR